MNKTLTLLSLLSLFILVGCCKKEQVKAREWSVPSKMRVNCKDLKFEYYSSSSEKKVDDVLERELISEPSWYDFRSEDESHYLAALFEEKKCRIVIIEFKK